MSIIRNPVFRPLAAGLALPLLALLLAFAGCDIESADSTTAVPSDNSGTIYNFSGLYVNLDTNGVQQPLVFPTNGPSGTLINWLRLLQYGSVLEAYDNEGLTWDGGISSIQGGTASFNLVGRTTAGQPVEIAGSLRYADQNSTMDASWIEPNFAGSINAQATVSPSTTNSPIGDDVTINEGDQTITTNGETKSFSATGGTGSYSWSLTGGIGTVSPTTGSPVTVTRSSSGTGTLSVVSGNYTDSVTISCP